MPRHIRSAVLAAILLVLPAATVTAADLGYDGRGAQGFDDPYDDPRYANIYGRDEPPRTYHLERPDRASRNQAYQAYEPLDDEDEDPPYADAPSRHGGYLEPLPHPPRFDDRRHARHGYASDRRCLPRELIRDRLKDAGWHDFHDLELAGDTAVIRARRPSGRLFEIRLDRCNGEIIGVRRLGPYALDTPRGARSY